MSRHLEKNASISPDQNRAQMNKDSRRYRHFELAPRLAFRARIEES
jgi:hypothetical protein